MKTTIKFAEIGEVRRDLCATVWTEHYTARFWEYINDG